MNHFTFREEERTKFTLRTSGLVTLFVLLLFFLLLGNATPFRLNAAEMTRLQDLKETRERDMVFRFVDSPPDEQENPDARFFSDADRRHKSRQEERETPENTDPISEGNTYELRNQPPSPVAQPQQQVTPSPPSPEIPAEAVAENARDEAPRDEPEPPETEEPEAEPVDKAGPHIADRGEVPTDPEGPKPYRRISKAELQRARQDALKEMNLLEQRANPPTATGETYHNPLGRSSPNLGFSIDTSGHDLGPYLEILRQLVKGNWRVPSIARFEVSGVSVVYFKLYQNGKIEEARVMISSEYEPLDTSALNAIINTDKVPPLPEHIHEPWIPIKFAFYYNMRPRY